MDLDIEQYNYAIQSHWEYSIKTIAGVCTQIIDTPVTRSSLLYENRSLIKWADIGISLNIINLKRKRRRDISVYLETLPNDGIPNKLRGVPILFGITIVSHFSSYLLDQIMPNTNIITNNNNNQIENKKYYYSSSMHLYNKCKLQNMSISANQIVDANAININIPNGYSHNWEHDKLMRKILISSLCSLITFPLYSIYVRIAFDFGEMKNNNNNNVNKIEFKYPINGFCTNIV
eukprot:268001_1